MKNIYKYIKESILADDDELDSRDIGVKLEFKDKTDITFKHFKTLKERELRKILNSIADCFDEKSTDNTIEFWVSYAYKTKERIGVTTYFSKFNSYCPFGRLHYNSTANKKFKFEFDEIYPSMTDVQNKINKVIDEINETYK